MFRGILKSCSGRISSPFVVTPRRLQSNTTPNDAPHLSPSPRLSRHLGRSCRLTLLSVVDKLAELNDHDAEDEVLRVLGSSRLTRVHGQQWLPTLVTTDVQATIKHLIASYSPNPPSGPPIQQPPVWVVLHLLCNRTQTRAEVIAAIQLVYHHLPTISPEYQPVLLTSAVLRLSELRMTAPLRYLVKLFLNLEPEATESRYNTLLCALSLASASKETSMLAIAVMQVMAKRQYKITMKAYDMLLRRQFATLDLVSAIENRMLADGFTPLPRHLQAFLRVAAKYGRKRQAARYLDELHQSLRNEAGEPRAPYGPRPKNHGLASIEKTEDNIVYLKSYRHFSHLFRHMGKLARVEVRPTRRQRFASKLVHPQDLGLLEGSHVPLGSDAISTSSKAKSTPQPTLHSEVTADQPPLRRHADVKLGIGEWIAGLYVASRDSAVSSESLLRSFRGGASSLGSRLSISGYLVVIRGLMSKGDTTHAVELWDELRQFNRGILVNTAAVGVGVKALTLHGEPHRAFAPLEDVLTEWLERTRTQDPSDSLDGRYSKPGIIVVDTINRFMISLQRIGRSDAVFELWDNMHTLYGLHPDAYTLNILLKTTRWAKKYDNTLRGALAHLGLRGRRIWESPESVDINPRIRARRRLASLLDPGMKPSMDGMWGTQPAPNIGLKISTQILLHNYPELRNVHHPVRALRHSASAPALSPVSDLFHSVLGPSTSEDPPDTTLAHLADGSDMPAQHHFSSIIPTDVTFSAYIDLLATLGLTPEIPLALAWMRTLNIFPSKTTLATALVHWAEVGLDAPLIERLKGGPGRSPYALLKGWMLDWVGEGSMPGGVEMTAEMKRLAAFRDGSVGDGLGQQRVRRP